MARSVVSEVLAPLVGAETGVPVWVLVTSPLATLVAALGGTYAGAYLQLKRERESRVQARGQRLSDRREDDIRDLQGLLNTVLLATAPLYDLRMDDPTARLPPELERAMAESPFLCSSR